MLTQREIDSIRGQLEEFGDAVAQLTASTTSNIENLVRTTQALTASVAGLARRIERLEAAVRPATLN